VVEVLPRKRKRWNFDDVDRENDVVSESKLEVVGRGAVALVKSEFKTSVTHPERVAGSGAEHEG
jgi:hypothetical protein